MSELSSQKQDEIDLIELFRELWNKKIGLRFACLCVLSLRVFMHLQRKSSGPQMRK